MKQEIELLKEQIKELKSTAYDVIAAIQSVQGEYKRQMDLLNKSLEDTNRDIGEKDQKLRALLEKVQVLMEQESKK
jgi:prefoldin subunit 5